MIGSVHLHGSISHAQHVENLASRGAAWHQLQRCRTLLCLGSQSSTTVVFADTLSSVTGDQSPTAIIPYLAVTDRFIFTEIVSPSVSIARYSFQDLYIYTKTRSGQRLDHTHKYNHCAIRLCHSFPNNQTCTSLYKVPKTSQEWAGSTAYHEPALSTSAACTPSTSKTWSKTPASLTYYQ